MSEQENDPALGIFPGISGDRSEWGACGCWTCVQAVQDAKPWPAAVCMPFIVCPSCGNKRCPKAMHHGRECSGSNEPGQPGSRFADWKFEQSEVYADPPRGAEQHTTQEEQA